MARGCNTFDKGNIKETPSDPLCKLLQLQAAPEVEQFDVNPLNYHYFMALLAGVVVTKIEEPRGRLTRLIKIYISMQEHFWKEPIDLWDCHKILSSYRKEIKPGSRLKFGDAKGFCKFYNFLLKCESVSVSQD